MTESFEVIENNLSPPAAKKAYLCLSVVDFIVIGIRISFIQGRFLFVCFVCFVVKIVL